jgi:hypothetical protein
MRDNRRNVAVMSPHGLLRQGITAVLRDSGHLVIESESYVAPRQKRIDVAIVDLESAADDSLSLVNQLRAQLAGTYLAILGAPMRIAAAANGSADAELELLRADMSVLRSVVAMRPPRVERARARASAMGRVTPRRRGSGLAGVGLDNPGIARYAGSATYGERTSRRCSCCSAPRTGKLTLIAPRPGCGGRRAEPRPGVLISRSRGRVRVVNWRAAGGCRDSS